MSRQSMFGHPSLVGFEAVEQALDRICKSAGDGYPPYNIERVVREGGGPDGLRIMLAVAGFTPDQLEISLEDHHLVVKGRQVDERPRSFLHRGIAARQFQRTFLLAHGMVVLGADLADGLLSIDLTRPDTSGLARRITIATGDRARPGGKDDGSDIA